MLEEALSDFNSPVRRRGAPYSPFLLSELIQRAANSITLSSPPAR